VGDGAEKPVMKCEMGIQMTRRGAGKGSGSQGCRGAEHGQICTKDRTSAVALKAALESAVQLGRGDEGNKPNWQPYEM
jgi:hypothetical protein